jgi:hypothetical protein
LSLRLGLEARSLGLRLGTLLILPPDERIVRTRAFAARFAAGKRLARLPSTPATAAARAASAALAAFALRPVPLFRALAFLRALALGARLLLSGRGGLAARLRLLLL